MPESTCAVEGCEKPRYQHREMCGSHFMRQYRYGDPLHRPVRASEDLAGRRFGVLLVERRERGRWRCRCDCGALHTVRVGDLKSGTVRSCGDTVAHRWLPVVKNRAAHLRVEALRGSASTHACVDCGGSAAHWSYDHRDPDELPDPVRGPYSLNPDRYEARCVPCHKRFDLAFVA